MSIMEAWEKIHEAELQRPRDGSVILFAGDSYYPEGGMLDCQGIYPSIKAAEAALLIIVKQWRWSDPWYHTLDANTLKIVGGYEASSLTGTAPEDPQRLDREPK